MHARRLSVVFLSLVLFAAGACAQVDVDFGFLAGANFSWFKGDTPALFDGDEFDVFNSIDADIDRMHPGMVLGVFTAFRPRTGLGLRIEAVYSELGGKGDFSGEIDLDDFSDDEIYGDILLKNTYLELPVLAIVPLGSGENRWSLLAGLSLAFKLKSEMRFNSRIDDGYYTDATEFTGQLNDRDYHALIGLECRTVIQEVVFLLDVRYKRGLLDVEDGIGSDPTRPYKHEAITATMGIVF